MPSLIRQSRSAALALLCAAGFTAHAGEAGEEGETIEPPIVADGVEVSQSGVEITAGINF